MRANGRHPHQNENAQGMVEFALVLPMLLLLIFGIVEVGRLLFIYSAVLTSSREAVRYGSAAGRIGGAIRYQDCTGIRAAAKRMGTLVGIQDANISISYDHGPGSSVFASVCPPTGQRISLGDRVIVQVSAQYQPLLPLVRFTPLTISSVSRRTILKDVEIQGTPSSSYTLPTVWFSPESLDVQEDAFGTRIVEVRLSVATSSIVQVPFTVSGSAIQGTDFTVVPSGLVEIPPGQIKANIAITVAADNLDEEDETIVLTMGTPLNATRVSPNVHTSTILDDDTAIVSFESPGQVLAEQSDSYSGIINVVMSTPSDRDVTVPFSIGGTATGGADYTLTPSPVTIPAGSTMGTIFITISGDALDKIDEDDETVALTLGDPLNATRGAPDQHIVTITDNDDPPVVAFTWETQNVTEATGSIFVNLELSLPSAKEVRVPVSIEGSADPDEDYSVQSSFPVVIPPGATSASIEVSILEDTVDEEDEDIIFIMGIPTNAWLGTPNTHTALITDMTAPPVVSFSAVSQLVDESGGERLVEVILDAASALQITVPFTIGGAAAENQDYALQPTGQVTIPPGGSKAVISLTLLDDILDEENETITLTLGTPTNATKGYPSTHTITIADNDTAEVSFSVDGQSQREDLGTMTVLVLLSTPSSQDVTVPYQISGAASQQDFTITPETVTIPAGGSSAAITITLINDTLIEKDETLVLTLGEPDNAVLGTLTVHTATILDDDVLACAVFDKNELSVNRSGKTVGWTVSALTEDPLVLQGLTVAWPDEGADAPQFESVRFGSSLIWSGSQPGSPATVSSWSGLESDRTLTSASTTITLGFSHMLLDGTYTVTLSFRNNAVDVDCPPIQRSYTLSP